MSNGRTGICHDCDRPVTCAVRCSEHAEAHAMAQRSACRSQKRAQVDRKIAAGICIDCRKPAVTGKRRCNEHLEKAKICAAVRVPGRKYVRRTKNDDGIDDMSGERCRCGLRLPCNKCLPTLRELVEARRHVE